MINMSMSEAVQRFLRVDRAPSTNETYRKALASALNFFGAPRQVAEITPDDVANYLEFLRTRDGRYLNHPRRHAEAGGLAPTTIEKRIKTLSSLFNWLVDRGDLDRNPAGRLKMRRYSRPAGASKAVRPQELREILEVAKWKARQGNIKHLAIFLFICDTGARIGEAAELTIDNLHLEEMGAWTIGKGDKQRPLFFGPETAAVLQQWLEVHPNKTPHARVFDMQAGSLSQVIYRMAKRAGIERSICAHAIRHRVGQAWSYAQMSEQITQFKLGHDDPLVTIEMYYNTEYEMVREASVKLSLAAIYGVPGEPTRLAPPVTRRPSTQGQ